MTSNDFKEKDRTLDRYVAGINKCPLLSREQELELAKRYQQNRCMISRQRLITSNLRFVVKVAHEYRGYGIKLLDLIQEGNMGLMISIDKFDPDRGYRLVSYSVWWIRAYIQSYVMRTWSLIKVGTTQAQRKLFFRLRSERDRAIRASVPGVRVTNEDMADILHVKETDVTDMDVRLCERDFSLDAKFIEGGRLSHMDVLVDDDADQEHKLAAKELKHKLQHKIKVCMEHFTEKERYVIKHRLLDEEPPTLQEIGHVLHISRERVRQIESSVINKLRASFLKKDGRIAA